MNTLRLVVLVLFLSPLGAVTANAQADNSCVYSYSFFCLTKYGTLASLHTFGHEHLDPANPFEGFSVLGEESGRLNLRIYPGFDVSQGPPSVREPKGPGKLPIIFTYGYDPQVTSTVTVDPVDTAVVFTMKVGRWIY